ncbi:MAG: hypothetical protein QS748_08885 [Candidatus Endonucleobacter bathymodioli]|uniref:Uncharacterized protein n=1 Tax=Candidatus Endonucleibacter bathymodioli TaxID=539814 RepID=A0AA90NM21_9GAMM|nr:hypothetical protein [Candidatus Endonucleobacter bathymodioli]
MLNHISLNATNNTHTLGDVTKKECFPLKKFGRRVISQLNKIAIKINGCKNQAKHMSKGFKGVIVCVKNSVHAQVSSILPRLSSFSRLVGIKHTSEKTDLDYIGKRKSKLSRVARALTSRAMSIFTIYKKGNKTTEEQSNRAAEQQSNKVSVSQQQ